MELILIILGCVMFIIVGAMLVLMFNEDQVVFVPFIVCLFFGIICLGAAREERADIISSKSYKGYEIDTVYTISNGRKIGVAYQIKEKTKNN